MSIATFPIGDGRLWWLIEAFLREKSDKAIMDLLEKITRKESQWQEFWDNLPAHYKLQSRIHQDIQNCWNLKRHIYNYRDNYGSDPAWVLQVAATWQAIEDAQFFRWDPLRKMLEDKRSRVRQT